MKEVKINRKILGECCREVLFKAAVESKSLRESTSFMEQFKVCKKVSEMNDIKAICMVFNEGKLLSEDKIRGLEDSKIKKGLQYGLAIAAGGIPLAKAAWKIGTTPLGKGAGKSMVKTGVKGTKSAMAVAALAVLTMYLFRTITDPCARECIKKFAGSPKKVSVCKRECEIKAIKKIIANINSQRSQCKGTAKPEKCERKLNAQLIKWKKKLQSKIIELSKAKEKLVK